MSKIKGINGLLGGCEGTAFMEWPRKAASARTLEEDEWGEPR